MHNDIKQLVARFRIGPAEVAKQLYGIYLNTELWHALASRIAISSVSSLVSADRAKELLQLANDEIEQLACARDEFQSNRRVVLQTLPAQRKFLIDDLISEVDDFKQRQPLKKHDLMALFHESYRDAVLVAQSIYIELLHSQSAIQHLEDVGEPIPFSLSTVAALLKSLEVCYKAKTASSFFRAHADIVWQSVEFLGEIERLNSVACDKRPEVELGDGDTLETHPRDSIPSNPLRDRHDLLHVSPVEERKPPIWNAQTGTLSAGDYRRKFSGQAKVVKAFLKLFEGHGWESHVPVPSDLRRAIRTLHEDVRLPISFHHRDDNVEWKWKKSETTDELPMNG